MYTTLLSMILAAPGYAAPLVTRQAGSADLTVVKEMELMKQFAALAESLEATFYAQALEKFTADDFSSIGLDGQTMIDQITVIRDDEQTHFTTLQSVATSLGGSTADLDGCQYDFEAAMINAQTFLATARVLEFVGVDAYIGGTTLIEDKALLVSAAEIATVEARHNAVLNLLNGGAAVPSPFDMVLSPEQVLSVAAPFISGGCDPVTALGLTPTPGLALTNTDTVGPGTLLTFGGAGLEGKDTGGLFCNMIIGGATEALSFPLAECVVPNDLDGPVHVFVVNSDQPLAANIVTQDASTIVAGPIVAFIDSRPNALADTLAVQGQTPSSGGGAQLDISALVANGPGKVVLVTEITVE